MQLGDSVGRFEWRSTRAQGQGWGWKLVKTMMKLWLFLNPIGLWDETGLVI